MKFTGKKCPVCSEAFLEGDDIVVCPKCGAPYHRACYQQQGKCIFFDLHKNKESWHSDEPEQESAEDSVVSGDVVICRHCGAENSKDSIVCEKCGDFLHGPVHSSNSFREMFNLTEEDDEDSEDEDGDSPFRSGKSFYFNGIRLFDAAFRKDQDFGGVTGEEMMNYVGSNPLYYLPIFSSIHNNNTSRFNFAAFFFGGSWYIYRKQYRKGILLLLLSSLLYVGYWCITMFYARDLWFHAQDAVMKAVSNPDYIDYLRWMSANCSVTEWFLMLLPYFFSLLSWVIMFVCGFRANRSYYRSAVVNIKKIKEENEDKDKKELLESISAKGGVKLGLAYLLTICQAIILGGLMLFLP